jgi:hypothetical protein
MKQNIAWKNSEVLKIARHMHANCPVEMIEQVRCQVIGGKKTRVHDIYRHAENAVLAVLPAKRQKFYPTMSAADMDRIKTTLAHIRSSNSANTYVPLAARKSSVKTVTKTKSLATEVPTAKLSLKPAPAVKVDQPKIDVSVFNQLVSINASLTSLGLSSVNRSKVLNTIVGAAAQ